MYKYLPPVEVEVAILTSIRLDVGILRSCQSDGANGYVELVLRVGMCLSRCSLRVNCLPQWEHQTLFAVDVVSVGIASTGTVTRLQSLCRAVAVLVRAAGYQQVRQASRYLRRRWSAGGVGEEPRGVL
jgi:hypothetical protein